MVEQNKLEGTLLYMDDVVVGGKTEQEHDSNVENFLISCERIGVIMNETTESKVRRIQLLGYLIENGKVATDPERMAPLKEMPLPTIHK